MTPEGKVKKEIKEHLDSIGFWRAGTAQPKGKVVGWYYMPVSNGMGVVGIPDFVGIYRGFSFMIEAKAAGKPTANQIQRHIEINAAGGFCFVCRSVSDVEAAILHVNEAIDG